MAGLVGNGYYQFIAGIVGFGGGYGVVQCRPSACSSALPRSRIASSPFSILTVTASTRKSSVTIAAMLLPVRLTALKSSSLIPGVLKKSACPRRYNYN